MRLEDREAPGSLLQLELPGVASMAGLAYAGAAYVEEDRHSPQASVTKADTPRNTAAPTGLIHLLPWKRRILRTL